MESYKPDDPTVSFVHRQICPPASHAGASRYNMPMMFAFYFFFSPPNLRDCSVDRHQTLTHVRW